VHYYLALVSGLGYVSGPPSLSLPLDAEELRWAQAFLSEQGISPLRPLVVIHPGGSYGSAKRWPPERFAALADMLQERHQAQIALIGSEHDRSLAEEIVLAAKSNPLILAGRTTLRESAAVLGRAALCITNDSGPLHVANALRTPVVAVFGPTDPKVTGPFHQPSSFIQKEAVCRPCAYRECPFDHRCMASIQVEDVYAACKKWLRT
jgi:heptosyltransferase-2